MNTRRRAHAWALALFTGFLTLTGGCYINHGEWNDDDAWVDGTPLNSAVCADYCDHLLGCDIISNQTWKNCFDGCRSAHDMDPPSAMGGIECVLQSGCASSLDAYPCANEPHPSSGNDGSGGFGGGGGDDNSGGWGGGGEAACQADCDCPSGNQCIDGSCKTPCVASCECAVGESCVSGYCAPPPAPQISCQVDCDCPSGQACFGGICGTP
ncbi:MAG: hypothetical protein IPM54_05935 [Polyangiaceae bacterium]|nr:hypothetical protein [Polyangiaceae bacterium]